MPKAPQQTAYIAADFFALRTPTQPLDVLRCVESLANDRSLFVNMVRDWAASPLGRESLYLASRTLYPAVQRWLAGEVTESDDGVVHAVSRYFLRSTTRATPFGLFSGISVGTVGRAPSQLEIAPHGRRHARLDMDALMLIATSIGQLPECRDKLRFWPSTSLTRHGDEARYVYSEIDPISLDRRSSVATVHVTPAMESAFATSREGALLSDIATSICRRFPDVDPTAARGFVDELVEGQLLVSRLIPPLSSEHPLDDMAATLEAIGAGHPSATALRAVSRSLAAINARPLGCPPSEYESLEHQVDALPRGPGKLQHTFQVNLHYDGAGPRLHQDVADKIGAGAELLYRIANAPPNRALQRFRERFWARYGTRRVRLVDALDQERGIGFEADSRELVAYDSPLFADLRIGEQARPTGETLEPRAAWMFKRACEFVTTRAAAWELTDHDIQMLEDGHPAPDAFACLATVLARNSDALASGNYKLFIRSAGGPAGANSLGRFCLGSQDLRRRVADHLAAEQALYGDDILAEVIHWPRGRTGNIIIRPAFREHEIVYLGPPAVADRSLLNADDLLVSVRDGEVILESARLGRRIRPRMASAHTVQGTELPLYRFLAAMRYDHRSAFAHWSWGGLLEHLPYLPRVVRGNYVFAEACWNLSGDALKPLTQGPPSARAAHFDALRHERGIPRWITVGTRDLRLTLDLDNPLCVELLLDEARGVEVLSLREMLPGLEDGCVSGAEGTYAHEITLPFVRQQPRATAHATVSRADDSERAFPPGSRWLTLQIYTGPAGADRVLIETIAPLLQAILPEHMVARWFFLRFGDPDWHLRLRIEADPQPLWSRLFPLLCERLAPALETGLIGRIKVDTYERETERYGGPETIELAEQVFHADSRAVLEILPMLEGDEGSEARWHLALRGVHDILTWFELGLPELVQITRSQRDGIAATLGADKLVDARIGARYRTVHAEVERVVLAALDAQHPYEHALVELATRRDAVRALVARIDQLGLGRDRRTSIALSLAHMFVNRLVMTDHRRHELLIYDFLWRVYRGQLARGA